TSAQSSDSSPKSAVDGATGTSNAALTTSADDRGTRDLSTPTDGKGGADAESNDDSKAGLDVKALDDGDTAKGLGDAGRGGADDLVDSSPAAHDIAPSRRASTDTPVAEEPDVSLADDAGPTVTTGIATEASSPSTSPAPAPSSHLADASSAPLIAP